MSPASSGRIPTRSAGSAVPTFAAAGWGRSARWRRAMFGRGSAAWRRRAPDRLLAEPLLFSERLLLALHVQRALLALDLHRPLLLLPGRLIACALLSLGLDLALLLQLLPAQALLLLHLDRARLLRLLPACALLLLIEPLLPLLGLLRP